MQNLKEMRIIVVSPNDVQKERDAAARVIAEINDSTAALLHLRLNLVRWETHSWPDFNQQGPQGLIDPILNIPDSDIVIGIFWRRFGTPTPDGTTGTEHELRTAYASWQKRGLPHVMVYFNQKPHTPDSVEEIEQWGKVLKFRKDFPKEGLWWPYKGTSNFEPLLRGHLNHLIRSRFFEPSEINTTPQIKPSPVPGNQSFDTHWASPAAPVANIPAVWNHTIGRSTEIKQIEHMLHAGRLVTILGAAGCGKTRVAVEVAHALKPHFAQGVLFVELASLVASSKEDSLVPSRIATIAGIREQARRPPTDVLAAYFQNGHFLLVLDNCEHLIQTCASVIQFLLSRCPNLHVLTTSRTLLHMQAEQVFPLWPLTVQESVELFIGCVQKRLPGYQLDPSNADALADVCCALDGLPLAIEVVAGSIAVRSIHQLQRNSRDLIKYLGQMATPLTAALKWSCDLLSANEFAFFKSLCVFDGGWTEDAADFICASARLPGHSALLYLQALLDQSLIVATEQRDEKRFRFLEPIRQFALSQVEPAEHSAYQRLHAEFFLKLSTRLSEQLLGSQQAEVLNRLQIEADNLRASIRWAVTAREPAMALGLIASLWRFCEIRGFLTEGRERAADVLAMPGVSEFPALRSQVLSGAGMLAYRQGDIDAAERQFTQSLAIERSIGSPASIANGLSDVGIVAAAKGDFEQARELYSESLAIKREIGDRRQIAVTLNNLGSTTMSLGDVDQAVKLLKESAALFESDGNLRDCAFPLNHLANAAIAAKQLARAREYIARSLQIRRDLSDKKGVADSVRTSAWIEMQDHQYDRATQLLHESLLTSRGVGDNEGVAAALDLFASLAIRLNHASSCVRLHAAADRLRRGLHFVLSTSNQQRVDSDLAAARQALGEETYRDDWETGHSLTPAQAIDLAKAINPGSHP